MFNGLFLRTVGLIRSWLSPKSGDRSNEASSPPSSVSGSLTESSETSVELCVALCKKWEGLSLTAYLCPAGVPTVGWGATGPDIQLGMTVTLEWAEQRIARDVAASLEEAQRLSRVLQGKPRKHAAIGSFIYNLGATRYKASTLKRRVDEERWEEATAEIQRWNKAGGKVLKGLILRRREEAQLLQD